MVKIGNIDVGTFPLLLAPMEDVSDPPFRALCKRYGADVMFTEFISSEGLIRSAARSVKKLDIFSMERPIGIQIFGGDIGAMCRAAELACLAKADFIDINYGCPVKKVVCKQAGAAILQDLPKMERMTREIVKSVDIPVTVKTRLGWSEDTIRIVEVALRLQSAGISALSIHARTRQQMYKGVADWSYIEKVCGHSEIEIPIFGNGDIKSGEDAWYAKQNYGISGIMVGRAAIGYPWIFREMKHYIKCQELLSPPTIHERVDIMRQHVSFSLQWKGIRQAILEMRPHYGRYLKGVWEAKKWRMQLVKADSVEELEAIFSDIACEGVEIKAETFSMR